MKENNIIKNKKPTSLWSKIGKRIAMGTVAVGMALGTVFGFVGCSEKTNPTPTPQPPEPPKPTVEMKYDEFITDHKDKALDFVENSIRPVVMQGKTIKGENWTLVAESEDTKLAKVNLAYTYVVSETDRRVEIAEVNLQNPVDFDDIVKGSYTVNASDLDINRTPVFDFNAQRNYNKQNIANALFAKADLEGSLTDLYPNAIYKEIESSDATYRSFELLQQTNNKITINQIDVLKGDGTEEALLQNINRPFTTTSVSREHEIDGTNIYNSAYTLEDLGPEIDPGPEPGPGPDNPDVPTPGDPVTSQEIIEALDKNCLDGILKRCLIGVTIDENKISDNNWYISKDTDGNITGAEYKFTYNTTNESAIFKIGKVTFSTPISAEKLKDGNVTGAQYSSAYSFSFDSSIQETRANLTNAICNKLFGENEGVTRFIKDNGNYAHDPELTEVGRFTVVEISTDGVKEISVNIKQSSNDSEYIAKLSNSSNYRTHDEKSYNINGEKVEESNTAQAKTTAYKYIVENEDDYEM